MQTDTETTEPTMQAPNEVQQAELDAQLAALAAELEKAGKTPKADPLALIGQAQAFLGEIEMNGGRKVRARTGPLNPPHGARQPMRRRTVEVTRDDKRRAQIATEKGLDVAAFAARASARARRGGAK